MIASRTYLQAVLRLLSFALFTAGACNVARADYIPLADVVQIAAAWDHSCAIVGGGAVKCWGANSSGQLGDGTTIDRSTPVDVVGLQEGVAALAVGDRSSCALTMTGGVKCWGSNDAGQLGDGTRLQRLAPVDVSGLTTGANAIAAGSWHACAVTLTGRVWCWGDNFHGQLGDGTTQGHPSPVELQTVSNVDEIAAGSGHTCALGGGSVVCWGDNGYGQVGDGSGFGMRTIPAPVVGLDSGIASIDAGALHTCVTTTTGAGKCWGFNSSGELGDGSTTTRTTPVDVTGLAGPAQVIRAGNGYSCALLEGGAVECWGANFYGTLGDGTAQGSLEPVVVHNLAGALALDVSDVHACAVTASHGAVCWGNDFFGQIGNATTTQRLTPVDVTGADRFEAVSMGFMHTCALTTASTVACWGHNYNGQLGDGTSTRRLVPTPVATIGVGARAIASGHHHSCAIDASSTVQCWGENRYGQLGDGSTNDHALPAPVAGLAAGAAVVVAGRDHSCAINSSGGVECWGENGSGQLGDGSTTQREAPVGVVGLASGVRALAAGSYHTCALLQAGGVKCWGDNWSGELGTGTAGDVQTSPVDVAGLGTGVHAISASSDMTCAATDAGAAKCWGYGIIGDGNPSGPAPAPVDVAGLSSGVVAITQGDLHVCAQLAAGVRCWGRNDYGQLGDGSRETRLVPTDVVGIVDAVDAISAGSQSTCALMTGGTVKCWGQNSAGQLGDGTSEGIPLPQTVVVPGDSIFANGFQ